MNENINLCSCFDMLFYPPKAVLCEWERLIEPTPEPFYGTELDGTTHFYIGNSRIKVSEHFSVQGKQLDTLIEDVIKFSKSQRFKA